MLKLTLRLMSIILVLFASITLLIHTQPFDDGGMRDLLFADGCSTPCFLGIQPGSTSVEAAEGILETQGMVAEWAERPITNEPNSDLPIEQAGLGIIRWRWSAERPAPLTALEGSLLYDRSSKRVVTFGRMSTRVSLGTLLVALGQPPIGYMGGGINDRDRPVFTHVAAYPQWRFNLVSYVACPMTLRQLWDAPVTLEMSNTIGENSRFIPYPDQLRPLMQRAAERYC